MLVIDLHPTVRVRNHTDVDISLMNELGTSYSIAAKQSSAILELSAANPATPHVKLGFERRWSRAVNLDLRQEHSQFEVSIQAGSFEHRLALEVSIDSSVMCVSLDIRIAFAIYNGLELPIHLIVGQSPAYIAVPPDTLIPLSSFDMSHRLPYQVALAVGDVTDPSQQIRWTLPVHLEHETKTVLLASRTASGVAVPLAAQFATDAQTGCTKIDISQNNAPQCLVLNSCKAHTLYVFSDLADYKTAIAPGTLLHHHYHSEFKQNTMSCNVPASIPLEVRALHHQRCMRVHIGLQSGAARHDLDGLGALWVSVSKSGPTFAIELWDEADASKAMPALAAPTKEFSPFIASVHVKDVVVDLHRADSSLEVSSHFARMTVAGLTCRLECGSMTQPCDTETASMSFRTFRCHNMSRHPAPDFPIILAVGPCLDEQEAGRFESVRETGTNQLCFRSITLSCKAPLHLFVEDTFVEHALEYAQEWVAQVGGDHQQSTETLHPDAPASSNVCYIDVIAVSPMCVYASARISKTVFLSFDDTKLEFKGFQQQRWLSTKVAHMAMAMLGHYVSEATSQVGWVLASLGIIGNPANFARHVRDGLRDLVSLPMSKANDGALAVVTALLCGSTSLARHIATGTLQSVASFTTSMGRNIGELAMDDQHRDIQRSIHQRAPREVQEGLAIGATGFGFSVFSAVAGLVDQPLSAFTRHTSATAANVVAHIGKGLVGALTKPVSGALDFISQTSVGLLNGGGMAFVAADDVQPCVMTRQHRFGRFQSDGLFHA